MILGTKRQLVASVVNMHSIKPLLGMYSSGDCIPDEGVFQGFHSAFTPRESLKCDERFFRVLAGLGNARFIDRSILT